MMMTYLYGISLLFLTGFSGIIPVFAIWILNKRKIPVSPNFLCEECKHKVIVCVGCQKKLRRWSYLVLLLFFFIGSVSYHYILGKERLVFLFFLLVALLVSMIDAWSKLVPNNVIFYASCIMVVLRFFIHPQPLLNYFLTSIATVLILLSFCSITGAMGGGDAKFLGVCALFVGFPKIILAIWIASVAALILLLFPLLKDTTRLKEPFPFAGYLSFGSIVAYIWGDELTALYLLLFP